MKRYFILTLLLLLCVSCGRRQENETAQEQPKFCPLGFDTDTLLVDSLKVQKGQIFTDIFLGGGMNATQAYNLCSAVDSVFPANRLRAGNAYRRYYQIDTDTLTTASGADSLVESRGRLKYVVYDRDRISQVIFQCFEPYCAWTYDKPVTNTMKVAHVEISTSLWDDMLSAGASPLLILTLSDVYAWTVDFFGLQKGDRFDVAYNEKSVEGEVIEIDSLYVAEYIHQKDTLRCYLFDQGDGMNMYWNEKGESMRKQFLKAPLHFTRISSGFSYSRKHPITRRVQPHTGVDYAAPKGTPVMSIGDGVVTSVKYEGAGGNTVRIRHNSVYSTAYLHLSGYAKGIKAGARVTQGQVIGYVGSTGRSTGPHLDFRVWKNGSPINPLTLDSPPAEPIRSENLEAFKARRPHLDSLLLN